METPGNDVSIFVTKLWRMVNDKKTDEVIRWGKDKTTFIILNDSRFTTTILPMYYKHIQMTSFIRQLNIYGFRKVPLLFNDQEELVDYEFTHPKFREGHPELLKDVKRKPREIVQDRCAKCTKCIRCDAESISKDDDFEKDKKKHDENKSTICNEGEIGLHKNNSNETNRSELDDIKKALLEMKAFHTQYSEVDSVIKGLKQENAVLLKEIADLRRKQLQIFYKEQKRYDEDGKRNEEDDSSDLADIKKVLSDAKAFHSQYSEVDTVINSLKQENTVLWKEIASLRQKQQKQLQIVNKLVQFFMTAVRPSARREGMGMKREHPFMIPANTEKKQKLSEGPTIHELDSSEVLTDDLLQNAPGQNARAQSPNTSSKSTTLPQEDDTQNNINLEIIKSERLVEELLGDRQLSEGMESKFNFSNDEENLLTKISDGYNKKEVLNKVSNKNVGCKKEPDTHVNSIAT